MQLTAPQSDAPTATRQAQPDDSQAHQPRHQQQHQQLPASHMIVNSQPYNPSQQAQQQRCVKLNQHQSAASRLTSQQQQNSLYGSTQLAPSQPVSGNSMQTAPDNHQQRHPSASSHMLDLMANLQQNAFDSAYDDTTSSLVTTTTTANNSAGQHQGAGQNPLIGDQQQGNQFEHRNSLHQQRHSLANSQNANMSLYSPSSSTSLLYHIYDQINDHQAQHQQPASKKNNSTILNPANLFGQQQHQQHQQQQQQQQQVPPATSTIQLHQQQLSQAAEFQKFIQQQSIYSGQDQYGHQQPFNTLHSHPHRGYSGAGQQALDGQMMLDPVARQQHHAATLARQHRPLSSSGASSMSGQSLALTYGRQPRVPQGKSQTNLASVLQGHQTLNHHLGLGQTNGSLTPTGCVVGAPKKFAPHFASGAAGNNRWKRLQQQVRKLAYEYGTIFKCSILFILLAFTIIKFTMTSIQPLAHPAPPTLKFDQPANILEAQMQTNGQSTPISESELELSEPHATRPHHKAAPDVLKSKVLIGEFVVLSQNYSHSSAQRLAMAENIVKLMDQVFLSTDVRRFYSRMEVTNIRANRPSGIVVDFNIILSDSIAYAAQQFGFALYDSLAKSNERLANQQSFVIDKSSIRFNTVPDKDLKSGIVPPGLISDSVTRELAAAAGEQLAPPTEPHTFANGNDQTGLASTERQQTSGETQTLAAAAGSVVWSEWSQWSSCVDKNGICDPQRLHSRLRECVAQNTGEKVDANQCRHKYNTQDQVLEVSDCSQVCAQQQQQFDSRLMSDAPSVVGPQTAPSVLLANEQPTFLLPPPGQLLAKKQLAAAKAQQQQQQPDLSSVLMAASTRGDGTLEGIYPIQAPASGSDQARQLQAPAQQAAPAAGTEGQAISSTLASTSQQPADGLLITPMSAPNLSADGQQQQQQQMSCSNCTGSEICLLLMSQKVPFCAKIKDRQDESGCGGWCKAQSQLCQPVGLNAFKCIHDSECLADEWRCHNSACIPLSKRCDGHSNCYDNSDERDCPN